MVRDSGGPRQQELQADPGDGARGEIMMAVTSYNVLCANGNNSSVSALKRAAPQEGLD